MLDFDSDGFASLPEQSEQHEGVHVSQTPQQGSYLVEESTPLHNMLYSSCYSLRFPSPLAVAVSMLVNTQIIFLLIQGFVMAEGYNNDGHGGFYEGYKARAMPMDSVCSYCMIV